MDRWRYLSGTETPPGERSQHKQAGVRLYDGDSKTNVEDVTLELTSHRLIIRDWDMVLDLSKVSLVDTALQTGLRITTLPIVMLY